uniref:Kinesin motor domain-containing protein n=1 Tax=Timema genevievae TaxID=629358 RepID=A0A7R9PPJ6_TIMGE|nr:unnamed protein product [Timema genevievae]
MSIMLLLLQECLGGNARTTMLATISPASTHMEVTLATLKYACRARTVINTPRVNESVHDRIIRGLSEEVAQLRALREECDTPLGRHDLNELERSEQADLVVDVAVLRHRVSTLLDKLREVGANLQVIKLTYVTLPASCGRGHAGAVGEDRKGVAGSYGWSETARRREKEPDGAVGSMEQRPPSFTNGMAQWSGVVKWSLVWCRNQQYRRLSLLQEMLRAMLKARTGQTHSTIATSRQRDGMRRDVEEKIRWEHSTGEMRDQHHNISQHPATSIREWRSLQDLSTLWEHDLLKGNRGSSASEHNLLEGIRGSSASEHDLLEGNRQSSASEHDLLEGNRGSSASEHDLLEGNRGSSAKGLDASEHDLLEGGEDSYVYYEDEKLLNTTFLYSSLEISSEDISQVQECSSQRQQEAEEAARRLAESGPYLTKETLRSLQSTLRALESRLSPNSIHHTPPTITPNTITIRSILRRTPGKTVRFLSPELGEAMSSSPESHCEATLAHSASPLSNTTPPQLYASQIEDNMPDLNTQGINCAYCEWRGKGGKLGYHVSNEPPQEKPGSKDQGSIASFVKRKDMFLQVSQVKLVQNQVLAHLLKICFSYQHSPLHPPILHDKLHILDTRSLTVVQPQQHNLVAIELCHVGKKLKTEVLQHTLLSRHTPGGEPTHLPGLSPQPHLEPVGGRFPRGRTHVPGCHPPSGAISRSGFPAVSKDTFGVTPVADTTRSHPYFFPLVSSTYTGHVSSPSRRHFTSELYSTVTLRLSMCDPRMCRLPCQSGPRAAPPLWGPSEDTTALKELSSSRVDKGGRDMVVFYHPDHLHPFHLVDHFRCNPSVPDHHQSARLTDSLLKRLDRIQVSDPDHIDAAAKSGEHAMVCRVEGYDRVMKHSHISVFLRECLCWPLFNIKLEKCLCAWDDISDRLDEW